MWVDILKLLFGLLILILGGDILVNGASKIALRLKLSPLVVGLTIVAFGTSAPELLISIQSALRDSPDIAMGNVIGSNIANLALVLGIITIITPIKVQKNSLILDWPVAFGSSVLLYLLVLNGYLGMVEGIVFVSMLIIYIVFVIRKSKKDQQALEIIEKEIKINEPDRKHLWQEIAFLLVGCAGLYFGADWFVGGAQVMANTLGVSERVVGLTIVAIGTSLPELVTSVVASIKKETDLALGNLIGSNIFNVLSILGITSIIKRIDVSELLVSVDMIWMMAITLIIFPIMITQKEIERWEGVVLLVIYLIYTYIVVF